MAFTKKEEHQVFWAYKTLFMGKHPLPKKSKRIETILRKNEEPPSSILEGLTRERTIQILRHLINSGKFTSEAFTQCAFPELYGAAAGSCSSRLEVETSSSKKRENPSAKELKASKKEAEISKKTTMTLNGQDKEPSAAIVNPFACTQEPKGDQGEEASAAAVVETADCTQESKNCSEGEKNHFSLETRDNKGLAIHESIAKENTSNSDNSSLPSAQLPFIVQHNILSKIQKLLEKCCYDFTLNHAPGLLEDELWDCPEAIELHVWTSKITTQLSILRDGSSKVNQSSLVKVMLSVNPIRHNSVHRIRISTDGVVQLVDAAVKFAEALRDEAQVSQLEEVRSELTSTIRSYERNKDCLELRLRDQLEELDRERQELARREKQLITKAIGEDNNHMNTVSAVFEERTRYILNGDLDRAQREESDDHDQAAGYNSDKNYRDGSVMKTSTLLKKSEDPETLSDDCESRNLMNEEFTPSESTQQTLECDENQNHCHSLNHSSSQYQSPNPDGVTLDSVLPIASHNENSGQEEAEDMRWGCEVSSIQQYEDPLRKSILTYTSKPCTDECQPEDRQPEGCLPIECPQEQYLPEECLAVECLSEEFQMQGALPPRDCLLEEWKLIEDAPKESQLEDWEVEESHADPSLSLAAYDMSNTAHPDRPPTRTKNWNFGYHSEEENANSIPQVAVYPPQANSSSLDVETKSISDIIRRLIAEQDGELPGLYNRNGQVNGETKEMVKVTISKDLVEELEELYNCKFGAV